MSLNRHDIISFAQWGLFLVAILVVRGVWDKITEPKPTIQIKQPTVQEPPRRPADPSFGSQHSQEYIEARKRSKSGIAFSQSERETELYKVINNFFSSNKAKWSNYCQEATKPPTVPFYDMYGNYDPYATMFNNESWQVDFMAIGICLSNIIESYATNDIRFQELVTIVKIPKKDWEAAKACIMRISYEYMGSYAQTQQMISPPGYGSTGSSSSGSSSRSSYSSRCDRDYTDCKHMCDKLKRWGFNIKERDRIDSNNRHQGCQAECLQKYHNCSQR